MSHLSDYGEDLRQQELDLFRKFVADFFYIDYNGKVRERYNELYEIHRDMPEFCDMIKEHIKEDRRND